MLPRLAPLIAVLCLAAAVRLSAAPAAAPAGPVYEMVFRNGDRLTGRVVKRADGKIFFQSDLVGDIAVPAGEVTLVPKPPAPVPPNSLAGLPPAPAKPAPTAAAAPPAPAWWWPPWFAEPFLVLEPIVTRWTGKVEFGYGNDLSTVRDVTTTLRAQAERNVGPDDLLFKDTYLYASSAEVPTTDQDEIDFQWRHNLDERLFFQSLTTYSYDKIRLINDDVEQTAELGYKLYANKVQTLDVGAGVMGQYLDATGIDERADYLSHFFQDYAYKISGRYTLTESASVQYSPEREARFGVQPDLGAPPSEALNYDYGLHGTLEGKITDHLSLNLHYDYSYDNSVLSADARADQALTTTLGYAF